MNTSLVYLAKPIIARRVVQEHDACLQSVEGMKVLCFELMEAASGRASAYTLANLAASANELVIELTRRVLQASLSQYLPAQTVLPEHATPSSFPVCLTGHDAQSYCRSGALLAFVNMLYLDT